MRQFRSVCNNAGLLALGSLLKVKRLDLMMRKLWLILTLISIFVSACSDQAQPTPFPAEIAGTATPLPTATPRPPLRFGFDQNTVGYINEIDQLRAVGMIEHLNLPTTQASLGDIYDIVAGYGLADGWMTSPTQIRVGILIDPSIHQADVTEMILSALDGETIHQQYPYIIPALNVSTRAKEIRTYFANNGFPDGIVGMMGVIPAPATDGVIFALETINIRVRPITLEPSAIAQAFQDRQIMMAVVTWTNDDEMAVWQSLFGAEYLQELYRLPIRYLAREDLNLTFTASGWPIPLGD